MNILVTGAKGFIGRNLISRLNIVKNDSVSENINIYEYDIDTDRALLDFYAKNCDFVFHLAGINRSENSADFMEGNYGFTKTLLESLKFHGNLSTVVMTSSMQAEIDNEYGKSKKASEGLLIAYGQEVGAKIIIYRLPNVFGKWCKPNYNSVVATFCNNIARGLDISLNDPQKVLNLAYIDDVVDELLSAPWGNSHFQGEFGVIPAVHSVCLGEVARLLYSFHESRENFTLPRCNNGFEKALNSTYLSYLPNENLRYPLKMNVDHRGSFTEIMRTQDCGQFSVNLSKPQVVKGNHWHQTKLEKFIVVSGEGLVRLRKVGTKKVIEYPVSGAQLEVVDIPIGYTHSIINVGNTDLVTIIWCNECFDEEYADTYFEEV